ncbi:hypothetical protein ACIPL1_16685 [Pseudomonas sp. NPDC090202]|uniref:hypothetical protein n=1 Tax=unclassified Pseudomonas TaxID=196821 RepID=UPI00380ACEB4
MYWSDRMLSSLPNSPTARRQFTSGRTGGSHSRGAAIDYPVRLISPGNMFRYLDHIQSGTVSAMGGYARNHRSVWMYEQITHGQGLTIL